MVRKYLMFEKHRRKTEMLDLGNANMTSCSHQNEKMFYGYEFIFNDLYENAGSFWNHLLTQRSV